MVWEAERYLGILVADTCPMGGHQELVGLGVQGNLANCPPTFLRFPFTATTDEDEEGKIPEDIMKVKPLPPRVLLRACFSLRRGRAGEGFQIHLGSCPQHHLAAWSAAALLGGWEGHGNGGQVGGLGAPDSQ